MTPEERRRRRIKQLAAKLQSDGESSLAHVCSWGAMLWGARMERVREYVEVLEAGGLIEVFPQEDRIKWVG